MDGRSVCVWLLLESIHKGCGRAFTGFYGGDAHAIDTRSSLVGADEQPCRRQHVKPVDSVVQSVKPKPRLLLCFRVELPSQEGELDWEYVALAPFVRSLVLSQFFRSGLLDQAVLLLVLAACISAGPLRSTLFPALQRYYESVRLPAVPLAAYAFAAKVGSYPHDRVSQVPGQSFGARCPHTPRKVRRRRVLIENVSDGSPPIPWQEGHLRV